MTGVVLLRLPENPLPSLYKFYCIISHFECKCSGVLAFHSNSPGVHSPVLESWAIFAAN